MPYKIKTKDEVITVNELELFRLFLSRVKTDDNLKLKIDSFIDSYSEILESNIILRLPIKDILNTFFILGYQFANFELKNDVEYEPIIKQSKTPNSQNT